jgi:hypothetical protein
MPWVDFAVCSRLDHAGFDQWSRLRGSLRDPTNLTLWDIVQALRKKVIVYAEKPKPGDGLPAASSSFLRQLRILSERAPGAR